MPRSVQIRLLPLPRGWSLRVRSAVVQVISLARTSLTLTQGWAAESLSPEVRRRAEEDRLQQEIQLLREEINIKDAGRCNLCPLLPRLPSHFFGTRFIPHLGHLPG